MANSVVATASSTAGIVSDTSDDPNSAEQDDTTKTLLAAAPAVNITKTKLPKLLKMGMVS